MSPFLASHLLGGEPDRLRLLVLPNIAVQSFDFCRSHGLPTRRFALYCYTLVSNTAPRAGQRHYSYPRHCVRCLRFQLCVLEADRRKESKHCRNCDEFFVELSQLVAEYENKL